jgi:hypothetical protein
MRRQIRIWKTPYSEHHILHSDIKLTFPCSSLQGRIAKLESQTLHPYHPLEAEGHSPPTISKIIETLQEQVSKLTVERDALLNQNDDLGNEAEGLRVTLETLQGQLQLQVAAGTGGDTTATAGD